MMLQMTTWRRTVLSCFVAAILLPLCGCQNVDWNWDTSYWRRPKRVVRPTRPKDDATRESRADRTAASPADESAADSQRGATPADDATPDGAAATAAGEGDSAEREALTSRERMKTRPFHRLYLLNAQREGGDDRGDGIVMMSKADARDASSLLAMLYPPMGRSGSEQEPYLIYENPDEFEAAMARATLLDVPVPDLGALEVGAEAAFKTGVGLWLQVLREEPVPQPELLDRGESNLAEALQSRQLTRNQRWTAGVLAGRLVSQYRYAFPEARSYYRQAERAADPGSLEQMSARWWIADSLVQEGKVDEARKIYGQILRHYPREWGNSKIMRRAFVLSKPDD